MIFVYGGRSPLQTSPQETRCDHLIQLLEESVAQDYIGEDVSQLEHALQCAHWAKRANPQDEEMILAALLHDIGHICVKGDSVPQMGGYGVAHHEEVGAEFLAKLGFSARVQALVKGHVEAKRYLVSQDPVYAGRLSPASQETLRHQGGVMSQEETTAFEKDCLFREKLQIRHFDELAKDKGRKVEGLDFYAPMIVRHIHV